MSRYNGNGVQGRHNGNQQGQGSRNGGKNNNTGAETPTTKLILNYLPPDMDEDEISQLFSSIGKLSSVKLMRDNKHGPTQGKSLAYAFVEYGRLCDAEEAVRTLNGLNLRGKAIRVSFARPPQDVNNEINLYVSGLPKTVNGDTVRALFAEYGEIISVHILERGGDAMQHKAGFVRFAKHHEGAKAIVGLNNTKPENFDDPIYVKVANSSGSTASKAAAAAAAAQQNAAPMRSGMGMGMGMGLGGQLGGSLNMSMNMGGGGGNMSSHMPSDFLMMPNSNMQMPPGLMNLPPFPSAVGGAIRPNSNRAATRYSPMVAGPHVIFVFNLEPTIKDPELWQLFGPYGAVQAVKIVRDPNTNNCKGYAFVTMLHYDEALQAINNLNGHQLNGRILQVRFQNKQRNNNGGSGSGGGRSQ